MKWVRDNSGRFPERPYYNIDELDYECEALVSRFLEDRYGSACYPIDTADLTVLAEQHTSDLDIGADLSKEGDGVEGVTLFWPDKSPTIRIDRQLAEQRWRENRLRTTLTHEIGHVKFHSALWAARGKQASFFDDGALEIARCSHGTVLGARPSDWMEWQAAYASGAMLMPISALRAVVAKTMEEATQSPVTKAGGNENLIAAVQKAFGVSRDAARVRLIQRRMLYDDGPSTDALLEKLRRG